MKRLSGISRLGIALALSNLIITLWVYVQKFEGSWGGFVLFWVNFPVSLLTFIPFGWNQWLFFIFVGPIWWYVIGVFLVYAYKSTLLKRHQVDFNSHFNDRLPPE